MRELMKKRQGTFRKQCLKYSRYVLNDHFVLFLLFFIGFLAIQYSQLLQQLPSDRTLLRYGLLVAGCLLIPWGNVATYVEKSDALFLLVKEEDLVQHVKQQVTKGYVFWLIVQTAILLLLAPLYLASGLGMVAFSVYIGVLTLAKWGFFLRKRRQFIGQGTLDWTYLIDTENARKQLILRFFALFTNVKGITNSVKRRAYLDCLIGWLPKNHAHTWMHLFVRSFLRNGDLFSMTLRLGLLSLLSLIFIPQATIALVIVGLLNYLVIFQLLGLYSAYNYQPLTRLFPLGKGAKVSGLGKTIRLLMWFLLLLETVVGLVFVTDKMLLLALLGYSIGLILVYLPFKMVRLVDENQ